jgi:hypothetical protein
MKRTKIAPLLLLAFLIPNADAVEGIFSDNFDPPPPLYSWIDYPNAPNTGFRAGVEITDFAQVFGHINDTDSMMPFPGRSGSSPVIMQFPGYETLAMQFVVPEEPYQGGVGCSSYSGQILDIAISTTPWDFPTDPVYATFNVAPGESGPTWSNYLPNKALLTPGQTYYYLFRLSDPQTHTVATGLNSVFGP